MMPLFSRSSFRTPRKPPRRNKSLPNIPQLDDSLNFTSESIKLDSETHAAGESAIQSSLVMKLGDVALAFDDGQWSIGTIHCSCAIISRNSLPRDRCKYMLRIKGWIKSPL